MSRTATCCNLPSMGTETAKWTEDAVPYICWDRRWTVADIRARLRAAQGV